VAFLGRFPMPGHLSLGKATMPMQRTAGAGK